jgi:hypothetical protein
MALIIYSPEWFYGIDSIFEGISTIVCMLIFYFSLKAYKLTSEKKYLYFSMAFLSVAVSFIIKIVTDLSIYFQLVQRNPFLLARLREINITYTWGYFSYHFFALLGIAALLMLTLKLKSKSAMSLFIFFIFLATVLSSYNLLFFYLTSAVILAYVFAHFYDNCHKKKCTTSHMVALSFLIILLSQLIFIFLTMNKALYVLGELVQLIGYVVLLFTYIMVLKK